MTRLQALLRRYERALAKVRAKDPLYLKGQTALDIYRRGVAEDRALVAGIRANTRPQLKGRKPVTDSTVISIRADKRREQARLRKQRQRQRNKAAGLSYTA